MNKSLATLLAEERRLQTLQTLFAINGYTASFTLVCERLSAIGTVVGEQTLSEEAQWLEDHGLVTLDLVDSVVLMRLTPLGKDVAQGRERIVGVRRPGP